MAWEPLLRSARGPLDSGKTSVLERAKELERSGKESEVSSRSWDESQEKRTPGMNDIQATARLFGLQRRSLGTGYSTGWPPYAIAQKGHRRIHFRTNVPRTATPEYDQR